MARITVVGSSNTDMVIKTEHFPLPGETIVGGEFFLFAGGKGANQAVAAARLGGEVRFVARVGNDVFGKQALAGFEREGMDCSLVITDEETASGTALITINREGENSIVVAPGANARLSPEQLDTLTLQDGEYVLTQLETPLETVVAVSERGGRLVLNPAPAQPLPDSLLRRLYLITPNESELALLTDTEVTGTAEVQRAAQALLNRGVRQVVVTLGAAGAYYTDGRQAFMVSAPSVRAVDTTAAGDVFNGALVVALSEGKDMREAIGFAITAASLSVTRMGAQASAPYRHEL